MIKLIHTSDWQLGKPFARMSVEATVALQEARLEAIDALGKLAADEAASDVLVAGDVFDAAEPHDRTVRQALLRMAGYGCRWWLLPGNHDYARSEGLWDRLKRDAPKNIHALIVPVPMELTTGAWLLPAPLTHRRAEHDPTDVFSGMNTPTDSVRIGLAHGPIQSFGRHEEAKNLIASNRAQVDGLDYLALGDWHGHVMIGERTAYSGTPEPDDFGRETTGGALLISIQGNGVTPTVNFKTTAKYSWREAEWNPVSGLADVEKRIEALRQQENLSRLVLRLHLSGLVGLSERVRIREHLESGLAHDVRWLDLQSDDLFVRPTQDELEEIDAHGVLRLVADRLQAITQRDGREGLVAMAALERLYVETLKARRRGDAA